MFIKVAIYPLGDFFSSILCDFVGYFYGLGGGDLYYYDVNLFSSFKHDKIAQTLRDSFFGI